MKAEIIFSFVEQSIFCNLLLQIDHKFSMGLMSGKSPTELDLENVVETQSDLFVLSSALEDCHQDMHVHLGVMWWCTILLGVKFLISIECTNGGICLKYVSIACTEHVQLACPLNYQPLPAHHNMLVDSPKSKPED
ncbi:hypothetical protein ANN_26898 [Periplaneta americana]|uniref:Uncharacterized protein n=1 Tax=Periplaneta americana TaxID=6978 RepID=A0ABQ8RWL0_PERAM|nr:hypothetical protein ANN_26898 [Periplaneta americana]